MSADNVIRCWCLAWVVGAWLVYIAGNEKTYEGEA
jgi:hypothetical protein